jgi:hypothetical protein
MSAGPFMLSTAASAANALGIIAEHASTAAATLHTIRRRRTASQSDASKRT